MKKEDIGVLDGKQKNLRKVLQMRKLNDRKLPVETSSFQGNFLNDFNSRKKKHNEKKGNNSMTLGSEELKENLSLSKFDNEITLTEDSLKSSNSKTNVI